MPRTICGRIRRAIAVLVLLFAVGSISPVRAGALVFTDTILKVFQFPPDRMPRVDGDPSDWEIVPAEYTYGTDMLLDVEDERNAPVDPADLDVRVKVGWVKGMNRLYFLYEAYDNYWDFSAPDLHNDMFEISVDADLSGGEFIHLDYPNRIFHRTSHAQNHHVFTPAEGKIPSMVWNCPPWLNKLPWANYVCRYGFAHGSSGRLVLECCITPFDLASFDGPEHSRESALAENGVIGLSWLVADWDGPGKRHGLASLSHDVRQVHDASFLRPFRLMPLEERFRGPIGADYTFRVVDPVRRVVAFTDRSWGEIIRWRWDFGDGTFSDERNPVHTYEKQGDYIVILTVSGPEGTSRRSTIWEVSFR